MSSLHDLLYRLLYVVGLSEDVDKEMDKFLAILNDSGYVESAGKYFRSNQGTSQWVPANSAAASGEPSADAVEVPLWNDDLWINDRHIYFKINNHELFLLELKPVAGDAADFVGHIKPAFDKFVLIYNRLLDKKKRKLTREQNLRPLEKLLTTKTLQQKVMATLSHEFRNPLNLILGFADLLKAESLNASHKEYLEIIRESGQGLFQVVKKVFQFLNIIMERPVDEMIDFRIRDVVQQVENELKPLALAKGLGWRSNLDSLTGTWVNGDMNKLHDVLFYLMENAIKFSTSGMLEIEVKQVESPRPDALRLSFAVKDQGKGIGIFQQDNIFEFFNQEDGSITRNYGGLGLGLGLADNFVRRMGGRLGLQSAVGQGSVFTFQLGFATSKNQHPDDVLELLPPRQMLQQVHVLIADDDPYQRKMAAVMLEDFKLSFAADGLEAINHMRNHPDTMIVLMDIRMPGMDGISATRVIRKELGSEAVILAVSGETVETTIEECFDAGMNAFVSKPYERDQLLRAILLNCEMLRQSKPEVVRLRPMDKLTGLKGLLVEDNRMLQLLTMRFLRDVECKASLADSVESALEILSKERFDFVLLDLNLPDGSGFDIAAGLRKSDNDVCIIAYSGEDSEETRQMCAQAGIDGIILKNYHTAPELATKINNLLHQKHPPRQVEKEPEESSGDPEDKRKPDYNLDTVKGVIGDNTDDLVLLLEVFIEHSLTTFDNMLQANKSGDTRSLSRHAHSLKSSARQFGMERAAELFFLLEKRSDDLPEADRNAIVAELEEIFNRAVPALKNEIEKLRG
ncbi:MAG: response regulator [Bacteroidetes bacterium]|nr:response regulator [Bacteroidota bacterium]